MHAFLPPYICQAACLPACLACLPQIRHLWGKSIGCNERKRVLPTSVERKSAGKMQQRRRKRCLQHHNSCWICIPTIFIIVVTTNDQASCGEKIVQTATCPWKSRVGGERCVLMIKAAVELRKVVRSNSYCLTYGDIQILDCMKDKILAELNKLMQRSLHHNLSFILV